MMIQPVQAADLQPGDVLTEHDWRLTVATAKEADWTDHKGRHHGIEVITRQLGPLFPRHFALAQIVQVDR